MQLPEPKHRLAPLTNAPRAVEGMVDYEWREGRRQPIAFVGQESHTQEFSMVTGQN